MLGIMSYTTATVTWDNNRMVTAAEGGGFDFIKEMISQSLENPGFHFLFELDRLFRKKVHTLQLEKRLLFTEYAIAHNYVMVECKDIWSAAREYARNAAGGRYPSAPWNQPSAQDGSATSGPSNLEQPGGEPRGNARGRKQRTPEQEAEAARRTAENEANRQAKLKRRAEAEALVEAKRLRGGNGQKQNKQQQQQQQRGGKGGGRGGKGKKEISAGAMRKMCPQAAQQGTCVYYNINDCRKGSACQFHHVCWQCGGKHSWADVHA